jgi:hypothetical protein
MSERFQSDVRIRLSDLLTRMRCSLPLPLEPKEVYRAAFPESKLADWLHDPAPSDMRRKALPYRNMVSCVHREPVVHFCMLGYDELDVLPDDDEAARFWIRFPRHVAAPPSGGMFILSESVRCNRSLVDWYNAAVLLDERINYYTTKIYRAVSEIRNPSELAINWPEVCNAAPQVRDPIAVKRAAARSPRNKPIRENIERLFTPAELEELSNMLATAIMLPATQGPTAWVGLHHISEDL